MENTIWNRMIDNFKQDPLYQAALTVPQILELKTPSEEYLKDNEVRQLTTGKYVDLMTAFSIKRKAVDEMLEKYNDAQERYSSLRWKVDRLIQFINITIEGELDAKILQQEIQKEIMGLSLNANRLSKEVEKDE